MKSKKSLNAKLLINPPLNLTKTNIKDDIYLRKKGNKDLLIRFNQITIIYYAWP